MSSNIHPIVLSFIKLVASNPDLKLEVVVTDENGNVFCRTVFEDLSGIECEDQCSDVCAGVRHSGRPNLSITPVKDFMANQNRPLSLQEIEHGLYEQGKRLNSRTIQRCLKALINTGDMAHVDGLGYSIVRPTV